MMKNYPSIEADQKLTLGSRRLYIGAYGFEERSVGWLSMHKNEPDLIHDAIIYNYKNPKGNNKIRELKELLASMNISFPHELDYDMLSQHSIESDTEKKFNKFIFNYDEVILDITAMTKFLILISLCNLTKFKGTLRIVYTEALEYAPTHKNYLSAKNKMELVAKFPSRGFETILRAKCLSSIRMQGQPVALVAFTSFNEQLVRHMLGTISPHLLLLINGKPPREDYRWREMATQDIHSKLIEQYPTENEIDNMGLLKRVTSTFDYRETIQSIDLIYKTYGLFERIIVAATGSKMQTVGLFFSKINHPDIHIEYPTPDSYFDQGMSKGIRSVHQIPIKEFSKFIGIKN